MTMTMTSGTPFGLTSVYWFMTMSDEDAAWHKWSNRSRRQRIRDRVLRRQAPPAPKRQWSYTWSKTEATP